MACYIQRNHTLAGLSVFIFILTLSASAAFAKYSGGTGDPNNPYQIATREDLLALGAAAGDYGKSFIMTADIDLDPCLPSGQIFTNAIIAPDIDSNSTFHGTAFTGTFDGNGHKISHLAINGGSNSYLGLFGKVVSGGLVKNLGVENLTVTGDANSKEVGGLVGFNYGGSISNCYSKGTVSGGLSSYYVGGLVGYSSGGNISDCYSTGAVSGNFDIGGLVGHNACSINNCYSTGAVSGVSNTGGLAGYNGYGSMCSISKCYSTGTVSGGSNSRYVGGLVGYSGGGNISDCYSTGAVSGGSNSSDVGGLVGYSGGGNISDCYSTGAVSGGSGSQDVGGLVGNYSGGIITECFWDIQTSGQTVGVGNDSSTGVVGKTTSQMQTAATFTSAGWMFLSNSNSTGNWLMPESGYPKLSCEVYPLVSVPVLKGLTIADANSALAAAGLAQGEPYYVYDISIASGMVSGTAPAAGTAVYSGFTKVHLLIAKDFRYSGGSGTQADPYQISDFGGVLDLSGASSDWGKYFILTADVNMGGQVFTAAIIAPDTSSSIGFQGTAFTGTFDGNGHKITNFTINSGNTNCFLGLFGQISSGGAVKNLGVENCSVGGDYYVGVSGSQYVGGLAGYNNGGSISNCYSTGSVSGGMNSEYVGGLAGYNNGSISNCYSTGSVSGGLNSWYVGGLVGYNYSSISKCYSTCTVSGGSNSQYVGGLAGYNNGGSISNCYSRGAVSGGDYPSYVGGLAGYTKGGSISNCYSTGAISGSYSWSSYVGGLLGSGGATGCFWDTQTSGLSHSSNGIGKTTAEMKTESTFTNAGWDFVAIWDIVDGETYPFFKNCGNSGTADDPYQIASRDDLLEMAAYTGDYNKCFILTADIDMGGQVFTTAIIAPYNAFKGTFDGNGHRITNFTINGGSNSYLGLFGEVDFGGCVKNVGVENCTVSGGSNSQYVGGLVGRNDGSISNCYSTGTVSGGSSSQSIGGLVGYNYGGSGTISNCYSTGAVSGASNSYAVGGLVGRNYGSSISNCYSSGTVSGGSSSQSIGGLVGYNYGGSGTISNCYSTGNVSGSSYVGGLIGYNYGSISGCYSTGSVSGTSYVGGLLGYTNSSASHSFWNTETSNQQASAGGTGLTTLQMKQQASFAGWDFTNDLNGTNDFWRMCADGVDYPRLNWESIPGDFACPDGVDAEDLNVFVQRWLESDCTLNNNNCGGADLNTSGTVEFADFAIFAQNWLTGTNP